MSWSTESLIAVFGGLLAVGLVLYYLMAGSNTPTPTAKAAPKPKQASKHFEKYSMQEIAKHNTKDDLWIIVGTKVYDVTEFAEDHPGEVHTLVGRSGPGQDATRGFYGPQHPDSVEDQIRQYLVGELQEFSSEEVAKHNKPDDCWIIIENKVYDVSSFVPEHPGGNAILKNAGGDSTQGFKRVEKHKSATSTYSNADLQMAKLLIGQLKVDKRKAE